MFAALAVIAGCGRAEGELVPTPDAAAAATDAAPPDATPALPTMVRFDARASKTTERGDPAGTPFSSGCPGDQALIGFDGATAPWGMDAVVVGKLKGGCGVGSVVAVDATHARLAMRAGWPLDWHGTSGAVAWTRACPEDEVVVGFRGRSGTRLDQLVIRCASIEVVLEGGVWVPRWGPVRSLEPAAGVGGGPFDPIDCPPGHVAAGLFGRVQNEVTAMGLVCVQPSLQ